MRSIKAALVAVFLIMAVGSTLACGAAASPAEPSSSNLGSTTGSTADSGADSVRPLEVVAESGSPPIVSEASSMPAPEPAMALAVEPAVEPAAESVAAPASEPAVEAAAEPAAPAMEIIESVTAETEKEEAYSGSYKSVSSLKAGETDDNQYWSDYQDFAGDFGGFAHRTPLDHRFIITVSDARGTPIPGVTVSVKQDEKELATGVTYANGQTIFHPEGQPAGPYSVSVSRDGAEFEKAFSAEDEEWRITLMDEYPRPAVLPLDVLFLLDATGSMADEIHQIKATLLSIADQVTSLHNSADLRFGMVAYRDRDDDYITRVYDFEDDISRFSQAVAEVEADGGGDTPESLNEALHVALNRPDWRGDDAIKLVFLVADAPPHLDYAEDYDYAEEMVQAREQGIKIFSVASSGLDGQGEYIFRQLAQQTMGKFIFILYGDGMGGLDTPHDVDQFTVNRLDQLIVRLIQEELESTNPRDS